MSGSLGRKFTFTPNGAGDVLTGLRSKSITFGGEPIDLTDDNSNGYPEFLAGNPDDVPRKGITIAANGLTRDKNLIVAVMQGGGVAKLTDYTLTDTTFSVSWTGDWVVYGLSLTAEHEGAVEFSATIQSTGEYVFDSDTTA